MKERSKKQSGLRTPRPKRVSMGELHYFALTLRSLVAHDFTWKVSLPPAFQKDGETYGEVTQC